MGRSHILNIIVYGTVPQALIESPPCFQWASCAPSYDYGDKSWWCKILSHSLFQSPVQVVENDSATGKQFHEKVTAVAHMLKWKGVSPNDHVLITVQPSVDFYAMAIAVLAIGRCTSIGY